ncbi:hypothetical protein ACA910_009438 [Epithemia clementina (nom. ined.)]
MKAAHICSFILVRISFMDVDIAVQAQAAGQGCNRAVSLNSSKYHDDQNVGDDYIPCGQNSSSPEKQPIALLLTAFFTDARMGDPRRGRRVKKDKSYNKKGKTPSDDDHKVFPLAEIRRIDGREHESAIVGARLLRKATPAYYADGMGTMAHGPNARLLSNTIFVQTGIVKNSANLSDMVWAFAQL